MAALGEVVALLAGVKPWQRPGVEVEGWERVEPPYYVRLDGVGFGRRAPRRCGAPRCRDVHEAIVDAATSVCREYGCVFHHVVSDEANLLFTANNPYGGRVFKIVSVLAGELSSRVSLRLGAELAFDARIVVVSAREAVDYLLWRMRIGFNNYIAQLYHEVYGGKHTPRLEAMLQELGDRLAGVEHWALTGTCGYRVEAVKEAVDERTGERVRVARRVWTTISNPHECVRALEALLEETAEKPLSTRASENSGAPEPTATPSTHNGMEEA